MARQSTGGVVEKDTARGTSYSLRFRAAGKRQFVHLGYAADGWTRPKADDELAYVLAQVQRGTWQPPAPPAAVDLPPEDPTFHVFASEWFESKRREWAPNTIDVYGFELTVHLLPFFRRHLLSQITVREVDRYREAKIREGRIAPVTINKTLTRLGQILDVAEERGLIDRNPMRVNPRNRKLKVSKKRPAYLDSAEHITAVLQAASELDAAPLARTSGRRALVATLVFAGLRVSEACALTWRDVNLAGGRITVGKAKTDAGSYREVLIRPVLRDELDSYLLSRGRAGHDDLVFTTAARTARDKDNVRSKVMQPVLKRADEILATADAMPLPRGVTAHKLRHTFASILFAIGEDAPTVMDQLGHADPKITLGVYAHMMKRGEEEKARLRALVEGAHWAPLGTSGVPGIDTAENDAAPDAQNPRVSRGSGHMGDDGLEPPTSCLSSEAPEDLAEPENTGDSG